MTAMLLVAMLAVQDRAAAEVWYGKDADNPHLYRGDISRVKADHAPRNVFTKVNFHNRPFLWGGYVRIYFDTRSWHPGPEFMLGIRISKGGKMVRHFYGQLRESDGGSGFNGGLFLVRCSGTRAFLTRNSAVWTRVPRTCLRTGEWPMPGSIRVSVESSHEFYRDGKWVPRYDWAPRHETFGPWLRRA